MALREKLNELRPQQVAAVVVGAVLLAALVVWLQLRPKKIGGLREEAVLKCTVPGCPGVARTTNEKILAAATASDSADPAFPRFKCPACGQNALAMAWECPNDRTIFFQRFQEGQKEGTYKLAERGHGTQVCPQCDWDGVMEMGKRAVPKR